MGFDLKKFKEMAEKFRAEGVVYPSIRAFHALVKDDYVERVVVDNYYAYYELRHHNWVLSFVDCFTVSKLTNIMLFKADDEDTVLYYSGEE